MSTIDHQIGFKDESTYGTAVTVDRFFEFESVDVQEAFNRTEGSPLGRGRTGMRSDRYTPWSGGLTVPVQFTVLTKGFGWFLKHMLGATATAGPTETAAYTHTGTIGALEGDFFTCQVGKALNPGGTVQPFTLSGGKVSDWTLSCDVDQHLLLDLNMDFQQVDTSGSVETASYPSGMVPLSWAGGAVTVGGSSFDIGPISIAGNNALNVDRRFQRASVLKKEPTSGQPSVTWSMSADFDSMTQRDRAAAASASGNVAQIVASWTGPAEISGTTTPLYPKLTVTIPNARFDEWSAPVSGYDGLQQSLSGEARYDGSNSLVTIEYVSEDTTA